MMKATARKAAEVMLAYANGEKIECISRVDESDVWEDSMLPLFQWGDYDYRVKPETRAITDLDDCLAELQKHRPYGYLLEKETAYVVSVVGLDDIGLMIADFTGHSRRVAYGGVSDRYKFVDGCPFTLSE